MHVHTYATYAYATYSVSVIKLNCNSVVQYCKLYAYSLLMYGSNSTKIYYLP